MAEFDAAPANPGRTHLVAQVQRPPSLANLVTDQIRELIITGTLDLGAQLSENTLAEQLNVSRTPVREAFMRLAGESLVEVRPQRGTFVFNCDAAGIQALCELREVLETGALRLAFSRNGKALVRRLKAINDAGEAASARSMTGYHPHDHAFHQALIGASDNPELVEAYARVAGRVRALRYRYTKTLDEVQTSQAAHRRLVDHLKANDLAAAVMVLRDHVYASLRNFTRRHTEGQGGVSEVKEEESRGK